MPTINTPQIISFLAHPKIRNRIFVSLVGLILISLSFFTYIMTTIPPTAQRTESVFVYGTLINPIIRSVACRCYTGLTPTTLRGYQKIGRNIISQESSTVTGAIIWVTPTELARLDRYEKVPSKYRREQIQIADHTHWVYLLNETS